MDGRYTAVQNGESGFALNDLAMSSSVTQKTVAEPSSPSLLPRRNIRNGNTYTPVPDQGLNDSRDIDKDKQRPQSSEALTGDRPQDLLPPVDIGSGTKLQCLGAIFFGVACFLACILSSAYFWIYNSRRYRGHVAPVTFLSKGFSGEVVSLMANIILTQCLEGLAYVHSISLRWALLKEDRLVFNTNIRLLTSSKLSRPNSWYINSISAILLIICYGATSTLVIPNVNPDTSGTSHDVGPRYVNMVALLVLGLALFGQTLLAIWCYYNNLRDIPSWSANPLNTTVTMLNQQLVQHREGRCMSPFQVPDTSDGSPSLPRTRQPSQWQASSSVRRVNIFIWILVGVSYMWFLAIVLVTRSNVRTNMEDYHTSNQPSALGPTWFFTWDWSPVVPSSAQTPYFNAVYFTLDPNEGSQESMSFPAALVVGLVFVCAIQGLQTLALHCAELIVNTSRDEDVWRALDAQDGSNSKSHALTTPPFLAALLSWKYDMLQIFKSLLHWLLGQSLQPSFAAPGAAFFTMLYSRVFVYCICATVFAFAIAFLAFVEPKGPQPATYGHIQTIADVIDDWTLDKNGWFWWGDKGARGGVRHAGMSSRKEDLGPIEMSALYAGELAGT